jgi:hypothetical protein
VFGYRNLQNSGAQLHIPKADVHEIEGFHARYLYSEHGLQLGADWSLLLLKKPSGRPLPHVATPSAQAVDGSQVYAIGHPHGLPMKICQEGYVNATCIPHVFAATLDTDAGNSGSPIFCGSSLIGVLMKRQETTTPDYAQTDPGHVPTCYERQHYSRAGREIVCTRADGSTYKTHVVGQPCTSASAFFPALETLRAAYR